MLEVSPGSLVSYSGGIGGGAWIWSLALHGSACVVVLWIALAEKRGASACCGGRGTGGEGGGDVSYSGGSGKIAWTWSLMLQESASVVVLWRALAVPRGASVCRRSEESGLGSGGVMLNSGGSGRMVWSWTLRLPGSADVLVL